MEPVKVLPTYICTPSPLKFVNDITKLLFKQFTRLSPIQQFDMKGLALVRIMVLSRSRRMRLTAIISIARALTQRRRIATHVHLRIARQLLRNRRYASYRRVISRRRLFLADAPLAAVTQSQPDQRFHSPVQTNFRSRTSRFIKIISIVLYLHYFGASGAVETRISHLAMTH